ncbi:MAG: GNAT family N-acetyltransferase [Candidatus Parcubacteria bacterium]|nr:GNAT family N-acetyltransferase [Candidatus Parcubacteria bacterium]
MEVIIQRATLKNLKDIQSLNLKLFEKEYREYDKLLNLNWTLGKEGTKYFTDRISNNDGCVFIAFVNDKIVGYLAGGLSEREPYRIMPITVELENTFIDEAYRSFGIGTKLFNEFINWSKGKKAGKIVVEVSAQNELGIKFYKRNGFKEHSMILEFDL